jgi:glycine cleavage system H protein
MASVPADLKYTASHEWVRMDRDVATVGITDHAQEELGDVVFVDLPTVGRVLQLGEVLGSIESVKAVSEIYAPVAGVVVDANPTLGAQSELVNSDPYGKGYLVQIKLADSALPADLMSSEDYERTVS